GSATIPAVDPRREVVAKNAGAMVMEILRNGGPLPRDLITRKSLENACAIVAATGGSTKAGVPTPALAPGAGLRFHLHAGAAVFERTPLIGNLQPGGQYYAQDVDRIGGVPTIVKALLAHGHLHGDTLTVSGQTLAQIAAEARDPDGDVIRPAEQAIART